MKYLILAAVAVALCGCGHINAQDLNSTIETLAKVHERCDVTVNYSASAGALNAGSGFSIQGTTHCPAIAAPSGAVPGGQASPSSNP